MYNISYKNLEERRKAKMDSREIALQITLKAIECKIINTDDDYAAEGKTKTDFTKALNQFAADEIAEFYTTIYKAINNGNTD